MVTNRSSRHVIEHLRRPWSVDRRRATWIDVPHDARERSQKILFRTGCACVMFAPARSGSCRYGISTSGAARPASRRRTPNCAPRRRFRCRSHRSGPFAAAASRLHRVRACFSERKASLTMATFGVPTTSLDRNSRPATRLMPKRAQIVRAHVVVIRAVVVFRSVGDALETEIAHGRGAEINRTRDAVTPRHPDTRAAHPESRRAPDAHAQRISVHRRRHAEDH